MVNKSFNLMIMLSFMIITMTMISRQQHILPTLLCLEALSLLLIYFLPLTLSSQPMMMGPPMIIMLTMSISSASLGLSMLILMSRSEGNDSMFMHSTHSC